MTNEWKSPKDEKPKFDKPVLIKCEGWEPIVGAYIKNPHSKECNCGIWVTYSYSQKANILNAPIEYWCYIPTIKKDIKGCLVINRPVTTYQMTKKKN